MPTKLPPAFNLIKKHNITNKVSFQGLRNTCSAFGTVSALEILSQIEGKRSINLSANRLFQLGNPKPFASMIGGSITGVLNYLVEKGLEDKTTKESIYITGYITLNSIEAMKNWLTKRGPLITYIRLYLDFFFYKNGIYTNRVKIPFFNEHHCLCIVGYDDEKQAWLCQNSWSPLWGDKGYCWIQYGTCGIDYNAWAITGITN